MRRVLSADHFREWFYRFLPDLIHSQPVTLLSPATVSDRNDPKIVHLDGLNLSRAWCMMGIVSGLPEDDPITRILKKSAVSHAEDALSHIVSGNYEGEHWLASFAVFMLSVMK